jgi:hypothetical protein
VPAELAYPRCSGEYHEGQNWQPVWYFKARAPVVLAQPISKTSIARFENRNSPRMRFLHKNFVVGVTSHPQDDQQHARETAYHRPRDSQLVAQPMSKTSIANRNFDSQLAVSHIQILAEFKRGEAGRWAVVANGRANS